MKDPLGRLFPNLPHGVRVVLDWAITIVGAVVIVFFVKWYVVNPYRIPSSSMEPTLHCARPGQGCEARFSDRVLANRLIYHFRDPHRAEVVVFTTPALAKARCGQGGTFVKRVIGLPGEVWAERNGTVYIDGKRLLETYIKFDRRDFETHTMKDIPGPNGQTGVYTRIPKGMYLMMGDNRGASCDSRRWGLVPRHNIIGEVFMTYWPPNRISFH